MVARACNENLRAAVSLREARWMAKLMTETAKQHGTNEEFRAAYDEEGVAVIDRKREGSANWSLVAWAEDITTHAGHYYDEQRERIV